MNNVIINAKLAKIILMSVCYVVTQIEMKVIIVFANKDILILDHQAVENVIINVKLAKIILMNVFLVQILIV